MESIMESGHVFNQLPLLKSPSGMRPSQSFLDVMAVEEAVEAGDLGDGAGMTSVEGVPKQYLRTPVRTLFDVGAAAIQEHENELSEVVIVCEPEGSSLMMGGLHPRGSLYERPVNIESAKAQHAEFRRVLRQHGLKVLTVREILAYDTEECLGDRMDLENLAMEALKYELDENHTTEDVAEADRHYISDEYKRHVVEHMSVNQLIDTILINPTVHLKPSYRDTGLTASYTFEPLSNLVYTRDQQITTCKGVVMGRLRSQQRQREVQVMKFCLTKLGLPVVGEIKETGYLEGGDFFPMGQDLAMLGIGLRSDIGAAQQLMDEDLLGTRRFAVVRDDFDRHQDRMHLDCVFSVLGDHGCLMLEDIIGEASPKRRLVDEYVRNDATGKYALGREGIELSRFMRDEGYHILPISNEHQLQYACNVLNLGDSRIISVHAASARQIVRWRHFSGDVRVIDFSSITSMYGSVHCASQVVKRVPRRALQANGA